MARISEERTEQLAATATTRIKFGGTSQCVTERATDVLSLIEELKIARRALDGYVLSYLLDMGHTSKYAESKLAAEVKAVLENAEHSLQAEGQIRKGE